jgi:peptide/nickel transport system permease protein
MVPLLIGISLLIFVLIQAAPGGPEAMFLERSTFVDPEVIESFRRRLGLDQPIYIQYLRWLGALLTGDFGVSYSTGRPALETVLERLPATFELMGVAFVIAAAIALPLGIYSAYKPYSITDLSATGLSFLGMAMPVFWFGLLLQLVFAVRLGWLPTSGRTTVGDGSLGDQLRHLVLPALVLSIRQIAGWSRYMRASARWCSATPSRTRSSRWCRSWRSTWPGSSLAR